MTSILEVENLSVDYATSSSTVHALRNVSLTVNEGEVLSLVGESGSGKSTFALAVSKLLPPNATLLTGGRILFRGKDLMQLNKSQIEQIRGPGIFMIFQNVFLSLNPLMKIKRQVIEAINVRSKRISKNIEKREAESEVASILKSVRIGDAEDVMERYPHQLSGGQNQRVMLAMALAEKPSLLIADEPTTALDVTTQAQVLLLLKEIREKSKMSIVYVTHDLAVAASISDRIAVLYGGMVQEIGSAKQILSDPKHPYTLGLIKSIPSKAKNEGPLDAIKGAFSWDDVGDACAFAPRCPLVRETCRKGIPALNHLDKTLIRCINYGETYEH
ncbi:MAG TPA: ABC transporter ATP-binding protein [Candidatus Acidoferrales bacterium]|nr:ABC transporter ATP-binding protein [Candidatus Acidoferrales bacterium]